MNKHLHKIEKFRHYIIKEIDGLTTEQLNAVPEGFNNNIIWNLGHLVAASQLIFYRRSGFELTIDQKYITPFLPTTKPEGFIDSGEVEVIRELAIRTIDDMMADFKRKDFRNYIKSENIKRVYGIELLTLEDALEFLLYHEGYHSGKIIAIKQLVITYKK